MTSSETSRSGKAEEKIVTSPDIEDMGTKQIPRLQKQIADQSGELLKITGYTDRLIGVITAGKGEIGREDADGFLIRILYYKAIFESFIYTVTKLCDRLKKASDGQNTGENHVRNESVGLSIMQAEQMALTAEKSLEQLKELEDTMSGLSSAREQEKLADRVAGLRSFQEKIRHRGV